MTDAKDWTARLEGELAHELGQAVTLTASAAGIENAEVRGWLCHALEVSGGDRLQLAVPGEELAALLVEARVIDTSQAADEATVRELWAGMLSSMAAGMGGRLFSAEFEPERRWPGWVLRLGKAAIRMAVHVEQAGVSSAGAEAAGRPPANYDLLLDVELDAAVRFGSCEMELGQLLELGPGDVVELDRHVADPVDLIVGDKIVARGEVVLLNGSFGLRVTEVAEPMRRLESIRCLW